MELRLSKEKIRESKSILIVLHSNDNFKTEVDIDIQSKWQKEKSKPPFTDFRIVKISRNRYLGITGNVSYL